MTTILQQDKAVIDLAIEAHLTKIADGSKLSDACRYALLNGGKRFRPALVLLVAKALGHKHSVMDAALAIEFFHTASLVADDLPCMDDDDERRNNPSVHRAFNEATALLVSYALIAEGYSLLAKNAQLLPNGHMVGILAIENVSFNTGLNGATGGQYLDLFPPTLDEATLRDLFHRKTGALFEIAFVLGWLFGGGNPDQLPQVKQTARHFGMAFQIADDLGDEEQDAQNQNVNLANLMGRDKALALLQSEIALYQSSLQHLGIASPELVALGRGCSAAGGATRTPCTPATRGPTPL